MTFHSFSRNRRHKDSRTTAQNVGNLVWERSKRMFQGISDHEISDHEISDQEISEAL